MPFLIKLLGPSLNAGIQDGRHFEMQTSRFAPRKASEKISVYTKPALSGLDSVSNQRFKHLPVFG